MFEGYRIICVIPAGRRRYLKTLIPYILRAPIVDELRLWRNTNNLLDIGFLRACTTLDARIKLIEPPEYEPDGSNTIGQFFRDCADPKAIYIRFDDDIVHVQDEFFPALLRFRIDHPEYFLVSPLVINNPLCAYILATTGIIVVQGAQLTANAFDPVSWQASEFPEVLHRAFLGAVGPDGRSPWHFTFRDIALNRFGINCISWLGRDFAPFDGVVPFGDEEEWLSVQQPCRLGRRNCFFGGTTVVHSPTTPSGRISTAPTCWSNTRNWRCAGSARRRRSSAMRLPVRRQSTRRCCGSGIGRGRGATASKWVLFDSLPTDASQSTGNGLA